jgi:hypothetical protein
MSTSSTEEIAKRRLNFDEALSMLKCLGNDLRSKTIKDPSLGFMVESLREVLKALVHTQDLDELEIEYIMNHYTFYIMDYVRKRAALPFIISKRSLIDVVGTDLCGYIFSFADSETASTMLYVCKSFNQLAMKRLWKSIQTLVCFSDEYNIPPYLCVGSGDVDLRMNYSAWEIVEDLTITLYREVHLEDCLRVFYQIPRLKALKFEWDYDGNSYISMNFFHKLASFHAKALKHLSLHCFGHKLRVTEEVSQLFASLNLESLDLDFRTLVYDAECMVEMNRWFSAFPSSLKHLKLRADFNFHCPFSQILHLNLNTLSLIGGCIVGDQHEEFFNVISKVSTLSMFAVVIHGSETDFRESLGGKLFPQLKSVDLFPLNKTCGIMDLPELAPNLEILALWFENDDKFFDLDSDKMPKLREINLKCRTSCFGEGDLEDVRSMFPYLARVEVRSRSDLFLWPSPPELDFDLLAELKRISRMYLTEPTFQGTAGGLLKKRKRQFDSEPPSSNSMHDFHDTNASEFE